MSQEPPSTGRPPAEPPSIVIVDQQSAHELDTDRWAQLAIAALRSQGVERGEVTIAFVDEDEMAALNAEHMDAEGPTDVLSFPLDHDGDHTLGGASEAGDVPVLLGDVVVCPTVAARNAAAHAAGATDPHPGHPSHDGSTASEIDLLVVHGVLHLLGHDHARDDERARMHAAERAVLGGADPAVTP